MINYEKSFKKLVEQIRTEHGWTKELIEEMAIDEPPRSYDRGMLFAYGSILELAEKLEKGAFKFDD